MTNFKKPERPQDHLGLDVKLETKKLDNDTWAQTTLKTIGQATKPGEMDYLGSLALHFYRTPDNGLNAERFELATTQQLALGDMNESVALMGLSNLTIEVRKHFGHKHSTRDTKDKRGNQ